jgi:ATP-dependent Clp protease protease subunit
MKRKFWNWVRNENKDEFGSDRTLFLNGEISDETWYGDEITPKLFRSELEKGTGNITVWINSPGGDVFSAAQIYNMLMDYKGRVTIKIDGLAASAASVIAMAGGDVYMTPVSMIMIHNPSTIAIGDSEEMLRAKTLLDEVKESIINAYELKSGLSRTKLSHLMDEETWMNANKAVELGFADKVLFIEDHERTPVDMEGLIFSRSAVTNSLLGKIPKQQKAKPKTGTPIESLYQRLSLISH